MKVALLLLAVIQLCACSMSKDTGVAEQAVKQFHEQMAAAQDDGIYDAADSRYKQAVTKEVSHGFLSRVRRKMGAITSTTRTGFRVNVTTSGNFVTLQYKTQCANGEMDETFVWNVENAQAQLVKYNVNSPAMLTD